MTRATDIGLMVPSRPGHQIVVPSRRPIKAAPSLDNTEMNPAAGSASSGYTSRTSGDRTPASSNRMMPVSVTRAHSVRASPLFTGETSLCLSVYAWESGGAIGELVEAMTSVLSERDATTPF